MGTDLNLRARDGWFCYVGWNTFLDWDWIGTILCPHGLFPIWARRWRGLVCSSWRLSLFHAGPVFFLPWIPPSRYSRPSVAAGTFPLAWLLPMNQPRGAAAAAAAHVTQFRRPLQYWRFPFPFTDEANSATKDKRSSGTQAAASKPK